jgi:hypothetical protein
VGLDGIRGDSYAVTVPAKQKRVVSRFDGLLLTDYYLQEARNHNYLQEARESIKNASPTLEVPLVPTCTQEKEY